MTEADLLIDMPSEPHVHAPKASIITKSASRSFGDLNSYEDVSIVRKLGKAKFSVYLAYSQLQEKKYVMKVFPLLKENNYVNKYFQNEIRFSPFHHQNIIRVVHSNHYKKLFDKENSQLFAYILMEYAPHGNLYNFLTTYKHCFNEKLVRTYFQQLINGLEYIHSKDAVHLDIKLENLLIDENFILKICDFDLSAFQDDLRTLGKGSKFYRAPEILHSNFKASPSADIYSAGIILFAMKCQGVLPHSEGIKCKGTNLCDLLNKRNSEFWETHCKIQEQDPEFFGEDFKLLFNSMLKVSPRERATLDDIKRSKWYNGPIYNEEELKDYLKATIEA